MIPRTDVDVVIKKTLLIVVQLLISYKITSLTELSHFTHFMYFLSFANVHTS